MNIFNKERITKVTLIKGKTKIILPKIIAVKESIFNADEIIITDNNNQCIIFNDMVQLY